MAIARPSSLAPLSVEGCRKVSSLLRVVLVERREVLSKQTNRSYQARNRMKLCQGGQEVTVVSLAR